MTDIVIITCKLKVIASKITYRQRKKTEEIDNMIKSSITFILLSTMLYFLIENSIFFNIYISARLSIFKGFLLLIFSILYISIWIRYR